MSLVTVTDGSESLRADADRGRDATRAYCQQLEAGHMLFVPQSPAFLTEVDLEFLLRQERTAGSHKNIAYRPLDDTKRSAAQG